MVGDILCLTNRRSVVVHVLTAAALVRVATAATAIDPQRRPGRLDGLTATSAAVDSRSTLGCALRECGVTTCSFVSVPLTMVFSCSIVRRICIGWRVLHSEWKVNRDTRPSAWSDSQWSWCRLEIVPVGGFRSVRDTPGGFSPDRSRCPSPEPECRPTYRLG